ncbi:SGNH/GDSL hydrolase family protein [Archangium gephyra]|uniref:SGNH/GDSL hydrolase family protein n=1 Tax=Archangium gephyra TaxID=48 RepID=UPI003B7EBE2B
MTKTAPRWARPSPRSTRASTPTARRRSGTPSGTSRKLIVINLGNNDFNVSGPDKLPTAPDATEFKKAYAAFVRQLREYYPRAKIVCSVGPMMNDNYPPGREHWTKMKTYVRDMVTDLGDPNVHYFAYTPIVGDPYGEDWHPTNESHAEMAKEIAPFIQGLGF